MTICAAGAVFHCSHGCFTWLFVTITGEPAYRKELREKRLREMHQRMQQQLAEKLARDAAESSEKEEKVDLRGRIVKPKIDAWTQGKKVCIPRTSKLLKTCTSMLLKTTNLPTCCW